MGATRPHNPAARGELLGATAPWQNRSRTKKNKPTLNTKLRILPPSAIPYPAEAVGADADVLSDVILAFSGKPTQVFYPSLSLSSSI